MKPLGKNILVKLDVRPEKTDGGLFIPQTAKDRRSDEAQAGTIVSIGTWYVENPSQIPTGLEKGQRVLIMPFSGVEITIGPKEKYKVIKYKDICVALPDKKEKQEDFDVSPKAIM